jgi:hypothetical protein
MSHASRIADNLRRVISVPVAPLPPFSGRLDPDASRIEPRADAIPKTRAFDGGSRCQIATVAGE